MAAGMSYAVAHKRANHNEMKLRKRCLEQLEKSGSIQYASNADIARDMMARRSNVAPNSPKTSAPAGWTVYHGAHGGIGWRQAVTGKIIYASSGRSPFVKRKQSGEEELGQDPRAIQAKAAQAERNATAIAKWYADHWNLLDQFGFEIQEREKHEAGLELYGTGIAVWKDSQGDGKWKPVRVPQNEEAARDETSQQPQAATGSSGGLANQSLPPQQFAFNPSQARVQAGQGPLQIGGREYKGGEWVPKEAVAAATPQQRSQMESAHRASAERRMEKGPVHTGKLQAKIAPHQGANLTGHQMREAENAYHGLLAHHGELLLHRVDELASDTQDVLDTAPPGPEGDEIREKFGARMKQIGQMADTAKKHGMHPEPTPEDEDFPPEEEHPLRNPQTPHDKNLRMKLDKGLQGLPPEMAEQFRGTIEAVVGKMSDGARRRLEKNTDRFEFHQDIASLTAAFYEGQSPTEGDLIGGMFGWDGKKGKIGLDGMDPAFAGEGYEHMDKPQKIAAHEIGHGIDGAGFELSRLWAWKNAYTNEIAKGDLSGYSRFDPQRSVRDNNAEGFAEFSRLLHSGDMPLEQVQQQFPLSFAFWQQQGILPDSAQKMGAGAAPQEPQGRQKNMAQPPGSPKIADLLKGGGGGAAGGGKPPEEGYKGEAPPVREPYSPGMEPPPVRGAAPAMAQGAGSDAGKKKFISSWRSKYGNRAAEAGFAKYTELLGKGMEKDEALDKAEDEMLRVNDTATEEELLQDDRGQEREGRQGKAEGSVGKHAPATNDTYANEAAEKQSVRGPYNEQLASSVLQHASGADRYTGMSIADLYEKMRQDDPNLSVDDLKDQILHLREQGKIRLEPITRGLAALGEKAKFAIPKDGEAMMYIKPESGKMASMAEGGETPQKKAKTESPLFQKFMEGSGKTGTGTSGFGVNLVGAAGARRLLEGVKLAGKIQDYDVAAYLQDFGIIEDENKGSGKVMVVRKPDALREVLNAATSGKYKGAQVKSAEELFRIVQQIAGGR